MSSQDLLSSNGGDIVDSLDQLKMDERLGPDGELAPKTDEEYAQAQLTLRAIVSSKEAGVIIGKGGKNVADLRDETGVKAGVSKVVQGVHDRVLTITGGCDAISRAYAIVARALLEGAPAVGMGGIVQGNGTHRTYFFLFLSSSPYFGIEYLANKMKTKYSHQASNLPQPNGYHYRSTGSQDQAYSRCFWRPHGCAKGNAATVN